MMVTLGTPETIEVDTPALSAAPLKETALGAAVGVDESGAEEAEVEDGRLMISVEVGTQS